MAASVVGMFAGVSVGNDVFGIRMVRDAESNPCPTSLFWFCWISCCNGSSAWASARAATRVPPAAPSPCRTRRRVTRVWWNPAICL
jgi:hypothetical protein